MKSPTQADCTDEKRSAESLPAPGSLATVLVASLESGTRAQGLTPGSEELRGRLSAFAREHGGRVLPGGAGEFIAAWDAGESCEEDAERAVRAALAMSAARPAAGEGGGGARQEMARIGIHTDFGSGEGPSRAARRISQEAPAGGVLLSRGTYRFVRGVFDVQPLEARPVGWHSEPVPLYLVERAKPRAFRIPTRGIGGIETRTVGRERELESLRDAYRDVAGGRGLRVVLAAGAPGVGKSRVLDEFEAWLELLPETILFFKGRATRDTLRNPNGLFRAVLSFRFDIRESDAVELVREKFRAGCADALDPDRADVVGQWLGFDFASSPAVASMLGSRGFRQQAMADLTSYFRAIAGKPCAIFLEDLHWADDASLYLLGHLARELADSRMLLVGAGRPALLERTREFAEGNPAVLRLEVPCLSRADSLALVEEILKRVEDVPEELRALLVEGAGGNPFHLEELVGFLADRGILRVGGDRWLVDRAKLAKVQVPDTLEGVLKARLRSLPAGERRLLQCASVVGRHFWDGALADLSAGGEEEGGVAPGDLSALLGRARERQLIFREASSTFEASGEYHFKHDLLRDFVYGTVLGKVRRAYHAQVARWLERNLRGRHSEHLAAIAEHFDAAGEKGRAVEYLLRAAEEMARGSAFREAIAASERALKLLPSGRGEVRASAFARMGEYHRQLGEYAPARRHLERALALARQVGDSHTEILALSTLGRAAMVQGAYAEAKPHLAAALALAEKTGDREAAAQVLLNLADASFRLGDAEGASASARESLQIYAGLKDRQGVAGAHRVLGFASMMRGDNAGAAHHHQEGLEIFEEIGDRWGVATCLINLGEVHRKMGRFDEAVSFWERSLPISRDIGARLSVAIGHVNMGGVLAGMELREDRARKNLCEALQEATEIGAVPIALEGLVSAALLYIREDEPLRAAKLLGTVVAHPSFNAEVQEYSDPLLKRVEKKVGPEALRAALDWGRGRDFATVVEEVVKDFGAASRPDRPR